MKRYRNERLLLANLQWGDRELLPTLWQNAADNFFESRPKQRSF